MGGNILLNGKWLSNDGGNEGFNVDNGGNGSCSGAFNVSSTTDATSISTGSLITAGGLGVAKAAWIGGLMNVAGAVTFQSSLAITGALSGVTTLTASNFVTISATVASNVRFFQLQTSGSRRWLIGASNGAEG